MEKTDENNIESVRPSPGMSRLGILSLIFAVAALPFLYMSIHRIISLHSPSIETCLIRETPFYNTIHTLCAILPAASATFAILSLMRCRRNKAAFSISAPAMAGLLLALASFSAYFIVLVILAHNYSS